MTTDFKGEGREKHPPLVEGESHGILYIFSEHLESHQGDPYAHKKGSDWKTSLLIKKTSFISTPINEHETYAPYNDRDSLWCYDFTS